MIHFFYGDEEFNISNKISEFKSKLDKNFIEMSFKTYKNPDFPTLISILRSQPMMFGNMLIVIDCLSYFTSKKKTSDDADDSGFDAKQLDEITDALESCNENIDIIFVAELPPDNSKKLDKRKKLFKLLSKYDAQEFIKIPEYKTADIEKWLLYYAKTNKISLSQEVASEMVLQIGGNLRLLVSELAKLHIFAGKNKITKAMVKEICTTNEDIFLLADCLATGNIIRALEEYNKLLLVTYPLAILAMLQTSLHTKILLKSYSKKYSQDEIAKLLGMHPYRVKCELQKIGKTPIKNLVKLKRNLTDVEYKIKTGQSALDIEKEIEYAILQ